MCADDGRGGEGVWTQEQGQGVVEMTLPMSLKHHLNTETKTGKKAPYFSQGTHLASDFWPAVL